MAKSLNLAITKNKLDKSCFLLIKSVSSIHVILVLNAAVVQLIANSLSKVDIDLRMTLYNEIVLSGGNTMFEGFP